MVNGATVLSLLKRAASFVGAALLAAGCATAPPPPVPVPVQLFADDRFAPPAAKIDAAEVFALSDSMRQYLRDEMAAPLRRAGAQQGLIDALYSKSQLKLEYDTALTRNAAQAFEARAGNCLSLVIMTAAFAKELGLPVRFQAAVGDAVWSKTGDLYLSSEHVNITLGRPLRDAWTTRDLSPLTIDFLPPAEIRGMRTREIDEVTVTAMFMNNRAAEALVAGRLDDAYWWARAAVRQSPAFAGALNTLGVVYLRHGDFGHAERAFGTVIEREPANTRAMSNLAQVLERTGRAAEAESLRRTLARIEPDPPFHYYHLGRAAMERGEYKAARDFFAKEVDRADYAAEFHFWLAVANFRLGDVDRARRHMQLAAERSTTRGERDMYAAKLGWMKGTRRE